MQQRRRSLSPPAYAPDGSHFTVATRYWERLKQEDLQLLSARTQFQPTSDGRLVFPFLNRDVMLDPISCCLRRPDGGRWERVDDPLLELATVLYLIHAKDVYPLGRDIVGPKDLKEGHFFQGPHELRIAPLVERYGRDARGFLRAAQKLGGEALELADVAVRLKPFPRLHLFYLLWEADDEFPASMSVLFDRCIENVLAADAIWGLVTRVSTELLKTGV